MQIELVLQTKNRSGPAKNRFSVALDCLMVPSKDDIILTENITLSWMASWRYAPVTKCYVTCGQKIFMTWR